MASHNVGSSEAQYELLMAFEATTILEDNATFALRSSFLSRNEDFVQKAKDCGLSLTVRPRFDMECFCVIYFVFSNN